MANLVTLTVQYTTDKTRSELINLDQVFGVVDAPNGIGSILYFGVNRPEVRVTENIKEVREKMKEGN
jgi:hypothetical protein